MLERLTRDAWTTALAMVAVLALAIGIGTAADSSAELSSAAILAGVAAAMLLGAMHSTGGWAGPVHHS